MTQTSGSDAKPKIKLASISALVLVTKNGRTYYEYQSKDLRPSQFSALFRNIDNVSHPD